MSTAWRIVRLLGRPVAVFRLLVLGQPVQAQDKPSAQELADLRALAEAGALEAQFTLGEFYTAGQGVPQDDAEAVTWYRQSRTWAFDSANVLPPWRPRARAAVSQAARWYLDAWRVDGAEENEPV